MATPPPLRELLLRIDELQLFPAAAQQVLSIARSNSATRKQLEEAVATDPVLAGRVIKLANSPRKTLSRCQKKSRTATVATALATRIRAWLPAGTPGRNTA